MGLWSDSIECFIEDQVFSQSDDFLAPLPPPHPSPSVSSTGDTQKRLSKRDNLLTGDGEGVGGDQIILSRESLLLFNHSILSGLWCALFAMWEKFGSKMKEETGKLL
jgi:hypothetical protein